MSLPKIAFCNIHFITLLILINGCNTDQKKKDSLLFGEDLEQSPTFSLDLTQFAPPETTGLPTTVTESNKYAWDMFAWQTFIAMNWPAVEPGSGNGYLRGYPDSTKTFKDVGSYPSSPLVWETFKEKREMFKHDATTMADAKPDPWSSTYSYGGEEPIGAHKKRVFATSKFATLDETVQVQAEARESYYDTTVHKAGVTAARVFRGTTPTLGSGSTDPGNAVRYEVKVNYDFYKYVVDEGLYYDPMTYARSKSSPPVQLPWRTSLTSISGVGPKAQTTYVDNYTTKGARAAYYKGRKANDGSTPPGIGSVHVKAAWAPITDSEKSRFIWREAEYFTGVNKDPATGLFGLVGLHIIQRIKVGTTSDVGALGGTFIFSTWEHKDIREDASNTVYNDSIPTTQYTYTNYFPEGGAPLLSKPDPALSNPFFVSRLYPILSHTQEANATFESLVGASSVWSNYRLVGTQFKPVDITTESTVTGGGMSASDPFKPSATNTAKNDMEYEPVFLSNLVIETNVGLQQFQGQPPLFDPVPQYIGKGIDSTTSTFVRTGKNISYGGSGKNMGGCMGCHGVAQVNGYSFSFVLLGGQAGADPDSESYFVDPLGNRNFIPAPVNILESRVPLFGGFKSTKLMLYLSDNGGTAVGSSSVSTIVVIDTGSKYKGTPFKFGDTVYIVDQNSGNYLTETNAGQVTFGTGGQRTGWKLYDPLDPGSTAFVLRSDKIGFQSTQSSGFLSLEQGSNRISTVQRFGPYSLWDLNK